MKTFTLAVAAVVTCALAVPAMLAAQLPATPLKLTAFAINMSNVGAAAAGTVDISITRWSTDQERQALMAAFQQGGTDETLDALEKAKSVGNISTPGNVGYDLRFARAMALPDGGTRIILATPRPIGFWESREGGRTLDYPFTFIELHLGADGTGTGKLSIAARLHYNKTDNVVEIENWADRPVQLNEVRIQTK